MGYGVEVWGGGAGTWPMKVCLHFTFSVGLADHCPLLRLPHRKFSRWEHIVYVLKRRARAESSRRQHRHGPLLSLDWEHFLALPLLPSSTNLMSPSSHPSSYCTYPFPILIWSVFVVSLVVPRRSSAAYIITRRYPRILVALIVHDPLHSHRSSLDSQSRSYCKRLARQSAVALLVHGYTPVRCLSLASRAFRITGDAGPPHAPAGPSPRPARAAGQHRCNTDSLVKRTTL